jgi:uncharacterized protein (TIGR03435 family)
MVLRGLAAAVGFTGLISAAVAFGQDEPKHLTFEVVSIKPWKSDREGGGITTLPGGQAYWARGATVLSMINVIYRLLIPQIVGGPDWIKTDRWDIDAKADHGGYNLDQLHEMYKEMLADRFKLKFHWEARQGPVYALTIDKSGLKMNADESPNPLKGGVPIAGDPLTPGGIIGHSVAIEYLAWWLGQRLQQDGRPVIDKTGLDGHYNFTLIYLPELPPNFPPERLPPDAADRPNIFTALREQLGLRLEPQSGPVNSFVIDGIEKPTTN